jgi:hypothetical protein
MPPPMTSQRPSEIEKVIVVLGLALVALLAYAMYRNGGSITGPFIFGDELEYFSYGRDLFLRADLSQHTQYGPLYPTIVALLFHLGTAESVYLTLRVFNIVVLASSAVPAYLLARAILPNDMPIRITFSLFAATTPFTGFGYLIWADPLYYALFLWVVHFLYCFYREPGLASGIVSGLLLALLFHAKSGAGVVVEVAAFVSVLALLALSPRGSRRRGLWPILALLLSCAALTIPGIIRNLSLGVGPIGYSMASAELARRIGELGRVQITKEIFSSAFYQLSYLFVGTWGLLGVLAVMPTSRWNSLPLELRVILIFVTTCMAGLIAMSAVGMNAFRGLGYWMPNGRYLGVLFPVTILIALRLLTEDAIPKRLEKQSLALVATVLGVSAALATPLHVVAPYSFVNNPDLALVTWLIDKGSVAWRGRYEPTLFQCIAFASLFGTLGVAWAFASKWRGAVLFLGALVLVANIIVSVAEHRYVRILGETQAALNQNIRFLSRQRADLEDDVIFDRKLEDGNVLDIARFWSPRVTNVHRLTAEQVLERSWETTAPRFFVSREDLALPKVFGSNGMSVYVLNAQKGAP